VRASEDRLRLVLMATNEGVWDRNVRPNRSLRSARYLKVPGLGEDEMPSVETALFGCVYPGDLPRLRRTIQAHLDHRAPYDLELRIRHRDGGGIFPVGSTGTWHAFAHGIQTWNPWRCGVLRIIALFAQVDEKILDEAALKQRLDAATTRADDRASFGLGERS